MYTTIPLLKFYKPDITAVKFYLNVFPRNFPVINKSVS